MSPYYLSKAYITNNIDERRVPTSEDVDCDYMITPSPLVYFPLDSQIKRQVLVYISIDR